MTNKKITFDTLDGYFLNTAAHRINTDYLNDCIYNVFDIEYRNTNNSNGKSLLHAILTNNRRKTTSLVWEAFQRFTNEAIKNEYYPRTYTATSDQLKSWLTAHGLTYDVFAPVVAEVERMRMEAKEA